MTESATYLKQEGVGTAAYLSSSARCLRTKAVEVVVEISVCVCVTVATVVVTVWVAAVTVAVVWKDAVAVGRCRKDEQKEVACALCAC